jgi:hypothetical protein
VSGELGNVREGFGGKDGGEGAIRRL